MVHHDVRKTRRVQTDLLIQTPYVMAVRASRSRAETDALMDWYADRAGITRLRRLATGEYPAGIPGRVSDEAALRR